MSWSLLPASLSVPTEQSLTYSRSTHYLLIHSAASHQEDFEISTRAFAESLIR